MSGWVRARGRTGTYMYEYTRRGDGRVPFANRPGPRLTAVGRVETGHVEAPAAPSAAYGGLQRNRRVGYTRGGRTSKSAARARTR